MSIAEKLTSIVENEQKVYVAGKKSQYDKFWDNFQNYGNRTKYAYAFASQENNMYFWNELSFTPKYSLRPSGNNDSMLRNMQITDFPKHLESIGVELDLSQVTSFNDGLSYTHTDHLGVLDLSNCSTMNYAFLGSTVKAIDKLILKNGGMSASGAFSNTSYLEEITIEGTIVNNGFNFRWSTKLTQDSLISIINALSPDTSGLTITFSKIAVNNAFGIDIDDETTYPEGSEFYNLRNTKSNWTFNYV